MSLAKECDRCGKLYTPYNLKTGEFNGVCKIRINKQGDIDYMGMNWDLCPECFETYKNFINMSMGEWIFSKTYYEADECTCSSCGQLMTTRHNERMPYCPKCGLKMKGELKDDQD